jgi:site-specific recombinase XerD
MSYVRNAVPAAPRAPTISEQLKILKVSGEHREGFRDHVILSVALGTGLREKEIAQLNVGDVAAGPKEIRTRIQLREYKGRLKTKDALASQYVFTSKMVRRKLEKFLAWKKRNKELVGPGAPLFLSNRGDRIATRTMRHMFRTWQKRAGIDPPYKFHALRHACMTNLYAATKDLRLVQKQARHNSVTTTQIYAHVSDEAVQRAVESLIS